MYYIVNNIYSFSYLIPTKLPSAICTIPPQLNCQLSTEDAKTKLKLKTETFYHIMESLHGHAFLRYRLILRQL